MKGVPIITIKDNDLELGNQWQLLWTKNFELFQIIEEIAVFNRLVLKKESTVITSIYRPEDTNSVHAYWRGVDLRSSYYEEWEVTLLLSYFNSRYSYNNKAPNKLVMMHHNAGFGDHLHVQWHPNTCARKQNNFSMN